MNLPLRLRPQVVDKLELDARGPTSQHTPSETQRKAAVSAAETAIRARRKLTNKLIAAHEAARLRPFLAADVKLISGDGALILGVDAVVEAFAGQFADPAFITYVRTTNDVRLDRDEARAAEAGDWVARWRGAAGEAAMSGTYLAVWRKVTGQWVLESELYVTLDEPTA